MDARAREEAIGRRHLARRGDRLPRGRTLTSKCTFHMLPRVDDSGTWGMSVA
jgi:hypothetical protein